MIPQATDTLEQLGAVATIRNRHRPAVNGTIGFVRGWHVIGGQDSFSLWTADGQTTAWACELEAVGRVLTGAERVALLQRTTTLERLLDN